MQACSVFATNLLFGCVRRPRAAQISWATVNQRLTNIGQRLANYFVLLGTLLAKYDFTADIDGIGFVINL